MSNRDNPDYRNSIKESISAIESLCVKIVGQKNEDTLGKALNYINSNLKGSLSIPESLIIAFKSLYKYTNSSNGIRHGLQEETNLSITEARFMLIACSAFVNYLISKADDAILTNKNSLTNYFQ